MWEIATDPRQKPYLFSCRICLQLNQSVSTGAHHWELATAPHSCHGVFTDRSIFSLNLSQFQNPAGTSVTNYNHEHGLMLTCSREAALFTLTEACTCRLKLGCFAGKKYLKIDCSVKMSLQWLIIGVAGSYKWAPGRRWYSSNHWFRSNLAEMLGLVREWLWQKSRSKYFIPFS